MRSSSSPVPAAVLVAVTASVALCARGLGSRSLWLDEAISRSATTQLSETLDRTSATMGLYYVLLTGWTNVFGDSALALRSLSVTFVAATVVLVFFLARRLVGQRDAVVASFVVALMPAMTRYGQEARSYALTALIATASWYCLVRATDDDSPDEEPRQTAWWTGVTLLSVLGVLSHGLFVLQVATQGASLLLAGRRSSLRSFAPAMISSGLVGLVLFQSGAKHIANWVPPLSLAQVVEALALLLGPTWPTAMAAAALLGLGFAGLVRLRGTTTDPHRRWLASVPVMWTFAPLLLLTALSVARPYLHPRYLVSSLPGTAILIAVGVGHLRRILSARWPDAAPVTVVVVAAVLSITLLAGQRHVRSEPAEDWRSVASVVAAEADGDDLVLFTQPDVKLAFDAAWSEISPAPDLSPVVADPHLPLGEPHRFAPGADPTTIRNQIEATDSVWVVHRTMSSGDGLLTEALATPSIDGSFRAAVHRCFDGGLHLVVLERVGPSTEDQRATSAPTAATGTGAWMCGNR